MKWEHLREAEYEAMKFVTVVANLGHEYAGKQNGQIYGTKSSGAVRRASMDLTRALAKLRTG